VAPYSHIGVNANSTRSGISNVPRDVSLDRTLAFLSPTFHSVDHLGRLKSRLFKPYRRSSLAKAFAAVSGSRQRSGLPPSGNGFEFRGRQREIGVPAKNTVNTNFRPHPPGHSKGKLLARLLHSFDCHPKPKDSYLLWHIKDDVRACEYRSSTAF